MQFIKVVLGIICYNRCGGSPTYANSNIPTVITDTPIEHKYTQAERNTNTPKQKEKYQLNTNTPKRREKYQVKANTTKQEE